MAERKEKESRLADISVLPGGDVLPTSPEEEKLEGPSTGETQDLKSVLVTSVLNLEQLDVDLYR